MLAFKVTIDPRQTPIIANHSLFKNRFSINTTIGGSVIDSNEVPNSFGKAPFHFQSINICTTTRKAPFLRAWIRVGYNSQ